MISCDEAVHICNKSQYREATLFEKLRLKLHILICKSCSVFSKKNKKLTVLCDKAHLHALSESDKKTLQKQIQDRL